MTTGSKPIQSRLASQTLEGKVALVTGAAGGIGSCIAEHFAAAGAAVMVADIREAAAASVATAICAEGGRASSVHVDTPRPSPPPPWWKRPSQPLAISTSSCMPRP
jgi:NAD(P)-dependent dehydrogenase (short-subunit alcohol dehydrogenase family)